MGVKIDQHPDPGVKELQEQVLSEERAEERADDFGSITHLNQEAVKQEGIKLPIILIGAAVYSFGVNIFLKPLGLYSGGFMGFSQLVNTIFRDYLGNPFGGFDITGIIYWILNVPALAYAYMKMRRRFFYKSIIAVTAITVMLSLIPIPSQPVLPDFLGNAIISGIITGAGVGIILRMGAADGGMDLVGMILISLRGKSSVGQLGMYVNMVLYSIYLFLFDAPTVIYSMIYSTFFSVACDRMHTQNINAEILVISGMQDTRPMEIEIMGKLNRGITRLSAEGAFTGEERKVLLIMASKYEVNRIRGMVKRHDPRAFIIVNEGVNVDGHFIKKLT